MHSPNNYFVNPVTVVIPPISYGNAYFNDGIFKETSFGLIEDTKGQGVGKFADVTGDGKIEYIVL